MPLNNKPSQAHASLCGCECGWMCEFVECLKRLAHAVVKGCVVLQSANTLPTRTLCLWCVGWVRLLKTCVSKST